jgi:hypothetical protein
MWDSNGAWVALIRFAVVHAFICDGFQTRDLDFLPFGASPLLQRGSMRMKENEGKLSRVKMFSKFSCV